MKKIAVIALIFSLFAAGYAYGEQVDYSQQILDAEYKNLRQQLIPKAIASIFTTQKEGGENAVVKQLKNCYESALKRNAGLTHELENCIAQDWVFSDFAAGAWESMKNSSVDIQPTQYVTHDSMSKRIQNAMETTGLEESVFFNEIKEIMEIANKSDIYSLANPNARLENKPFTGELEFKNGIAFIPSTEKPFTGRWVASDGKRRFDAIFKNGRENGLRTVWDGNGQKIAEEIFKNGNLNGLATYWYDNGQIVVKKTFKNGKEINTKKYENKPKRSAVMQEIINRCRTQMGEYGAAMVKACIDQDIEAEKALLKY